MIPNLSMMGEKDWIENEDHQVDTGFVSCDINGYDESALEIALRIKDKTNSRLRAITIGEHYSFINNLYALKYDEVVRIDHHRDITFYSEIIAETLSSFIKKADSQEDLILMGCQNGVGDNAKTPFLLAEILGIPCITEVLAIEASDEEGVILIESMCDDGILRQKITLPCVAAVGNAPKSYLRVPTLMDKMKFKNKSVIVHSLSDFCTEERIHDIHKDYSVVGLKKYNNSRQPLMIEGNDMNEKVKLLLKEYLIGRVL
jgi:electron transfer flavoprotein alpha/beta subunit